jgi:hypothetical protein
MGLYAIPALGDLLSDITCDAMVGAEILESLPPPPRPLRATMPWNPESSVGKHENQLVRAVYALPLLFIFYGAGQKMGRRTENFLLPLVKASQIGNLLWMLGRWAPLCRRFFGIKSLDDFISIYVGFFTPSIGGFGTAGRMQTIAFLGDLEPIQAI